MFLSYENVNKSASKLGSLIGEMVVFKIISILRKFSDFNTCYILIHVPII